MATEWEYKKECDAWAYDIGRFIGGENFGGFVSDFLKQHGRIATRKHFMAALRSGDPKSYIGGVRRNAIQKKVNDTPEGTRMGMYEMRGGKWVQWIEKFEYDKLKEKQHTDKVMDESRLRRNERGGK